MSRRADRVKPVGWRAATEARMALADERAAKLAPIIKMLQANGVTSLSGIADFGPSRTVIPTHRGQHSGDCGQLLMSV
jgi:hypothetical protein